MNRFLGKYISILAIIALFVSNIFSTVVADNLPVNTPKEPNTPSVQPKTDDNTTDETKKIEENQEFLNRIKKELNFSKTDYKQLLNGISDAKGKLEQLKNEKFSLNSQIQNLDLQIELSTERLVQVIGEMVEQENKLILLQNEIEMREIALEVQKKQLVEYLKFLYTEENAILNVEKDGSIDALKLLLSDGNVGDNLRILDYIDLLNETGQQLVENLKDINEELNLHKKELEIARKKMDDLRVKLTAEKEELKLEKSSKENLVKITEGQEDIYSKLLEDTLKQQEDLVSEIKQLSNAVDFIEIKIKTDGANFDPKKYESILGKKNQALYKFKVENLGTDIGDFMWPVSPDRGISAYFHDSGYAASFGVQHNAIDIPEYQGSPIYAANDGVVYSAKDNGYGYSYIIIAHADDFMTVYGHVSSILVEEGQTISKGSIIGLTGGMPGTKGAGYMTTGPHLHFEMLKNGKYTDPLYQLPLNVLTADQIEALPEKYVDDWKNSILKEDL